MHLICVNDIGIIGIEVAEHSDLNSSCFLREPSLLGFAYDLEQELKPRRMPKFLSSVPPLPPDAGICDMLPKPNQSQAGLTHLRRHWGTNKPIPGL
jgi:hypothetical protein